MTTYRSLSLLSKPTGDERIRAGTLGYFNARNKSRAYDAVIKEFLESGISQATLARRLGKDPGVVCRLLSGPGNWTLDTVSELLFAISGGEAGYQISYPLDESFRNYTQPEWLETSTSTEQRITGNLSITVAGLETHAASATSTQVAIYSRVN